jgi:hypothetical protein
MRDRLIKKAQSSPCTYKISAIGIDNKGRVIDCCNNHQRFSHEGGGVHSEAKLIARNPRSLRTIIICRVNKTGDLLPIDPCESCKRIATNHNITIKSIQ